MWYFRHHFFPRARAKALERRGSLHWSNLYQVMGAENGSIMITPTPNLDAQLAWLIEEDAFEDLLDPELQMPGGRRSYFRRLMEVLREWVSKKDVEELFFDAQRRHAPFGWVQSIDKVAENPQSKARGWWREQSLGGRTVSVPGAPFQFRGTPGNPITSEQRNPQQRRRSGEERRLGGSHTRPLEGIRILDFTHVLAGPFATRVLADMSADVVKVNSMERAAGNPAGSPYYTIWNRNKRALALDMSTDDARSIAKALALKADVVIDNFSHGVLDRGESDTTLWDKRTQQLYMSRCQGWARADRGATSSLTRQLFMR